MNSVLTITRSAVLFLAASAFGISGCRLGNQIKNAPDPVSVQYFQTAPKSLIFCATPASNTPDVCKPVSLTKIPALVSKVMTQPVALVVDQSQKIASLVGMNADQFSLPTHLNADNTLGFTGETTPAPLWLDKACITQLLFQERDGKITPLASGEPTTAIVTQAGSSQSYSVPLAGRLELSFDVVQVFAGDCESSLKAMQDCYTNNNQCGGQTARENLELQAVVQSYFEDAIEAGVLAPADIATVTQISYSVSYQ